MALKNYPLREVFNVGQLDKYTGPINEDEFLDADYTTDDATQANQ